MLNEGVDALFRGIQPEDGAIHVESIRKFVSLSLFRCIAPYSNENQFQNKNRLFRLVQKKKICLLTDDGIARIIGIVITVLILGLSYTVYQLAIEIFGHILTVCRSKFRLSVWYQ